MPKIKKLSNDVVAKIAAGEVVDRPESVVKELVENSIDAKADAIKISIIAGGTKDITIIDNGEGMDRLDLLECYKRHTTSKLNNLQDLSSIHSLGFRGEAIYSVSAVSDLEISTRNKKSIAGNFVRLAEGNLVEEGIVGMPIGTKVTVKNIFHSLPARKKFLKSDTVELKYISDTVLQLCIGHPEISFNFSHNGRTLLDVVKDKDHVSRIRSVFPETFFKDLIPLKKTYEEFELYGFISRPQVARFSKSKQFLYINNRYIKDNLVSDAVKHAYGNLLDTKKIPPFILFLKLPTSFIDVNVHPKKQKIKFLNRSELYKFIHSAALEALEREDLTNIKHGFSSLSAMLNDYSIESVSNSYLKDINDSYEMNESGILQVHNMYLIQETNTGLAIYDQHAVEERIIYDQLQTIYENSSKDSKELIHTIPLEFDMSDTVMLSMYIQILKNIGFEIKKNVKNKYEIYCAPSILIGRGIGNIILEILDELSQEKKISKIDSYADLALSHLACKAAIKGGEYIPPITRKILLDRLQQTKVKYTCPHGRPLKIEIPLAELHKWFSRT